MKIFECLEFYSVNALGGRYRIDVHSKSYNGFKSDIIGGSGNSFNVRGDVSDFLNYGQAVLIDGSLDFINSFTYFEASNRTEIIVQSATYNFQSTIENDSTNGASYIPVFSPETTSQTIEWANEGDELLQPLKPSTLQFNLINNDAYFDYFESKRLENNDDDLSVVLYKHDGTSFVKYWVGCIVKDGLEWSNMDKPRPYTYRAICGINKLKDVPYNADIDNLETKKAIDVIRDVLAVNELTDFWNSSEDYIKESIEYQSDLISSPTNADSPLEYTYIPDNVFIDQTSKTDNEFISCYDVLKDIMSSFSSRMYMANGVYYITQVRNIGSNTNIAFRNFTKDKSYPLNYTTSNDPYKVALDAMEGGTFNYERGLRSVKINQISNNEISTNLSNGWYGNFLVSGPPKTDQITVGGTSLGSPNITYGLGNISGGIGSGKVLSLSLRLKQLKGYSGYTRLRISITEAAGSNKYLVGGPTRPIEWRDDAVGINRHYEYRVYPSSNGTNNYVNIETPELPFDLADAVVNIEMAILFSGAYTSSVNNGTYYSIFDIKSIVPNNDGTDGVEIEVLNTINSQFTTDLELDSLRITEVTNATSINTLLINTAFRTSSTPGTRTFEESTIWDAGFDTDAGLSYTRALEAMSVQIDNLEIYRGSFNGLILPFQALDYNDKIYYFNGYRIDLKSGESEGEWVEADGVRGGLSVGGGGYPTGGGLGDARIGSDFNGAYLNESEQVATLYQPIAEGAVTSIQLSDIDANSIKVGDYISVYDPHTKGELITLKVETLTDSESGYFDVDVSPQTVDFEIPSGMVIRHNKKTLIQSGIVRADTFEHTGVAVEPIVLGDMKDNEITIVGGNIYIKSGSIIYKHTGVVHIP